MTPGPVAGLTAAEYDDPVFFCGYQAMRRHRAGLNEQLEQPALARLLPDPAGLRLTGIDEPAPDDNAIAGRPDLAQHRRRPPVLILSAQKPAGPEPGAGMNGRPDGL